MANQAPLFTLLDCDNGVYYLRQAYYWIIRSQAGQQAATFDQKLLLFSTYKQASEMKNNFNQECFVESMFWEEIVFHFRTGCLQALVDFSGDPDGGFLLNLIHDPDALVAEQINC